MSARPFVDWTRLPSELGRAAIDLALSGVPVFPLQPRSKLPYRGSRGCLDATTDPLAVGRAWTARPDSNIGVTAVYAVDLDSLAAEAAWLRLIAGKPSPRTLEVRTHRGRHIWFVDPTSELSNTTGRLGPGIDTRGRHGYVLAPPSIHPLGSRYRWLTPLGPVEPLPGWLIRLLTPPPPPPRPTRVVRLVEGEVTREGHARIDGAVRLLERTAKGARHARLYWAARLAGALEQAGLIGPGIAAPMLRDAADACGLTADEGERIVDRTIQDGLTKGGAL
jgi:hypothetical protein